MTGLRTRGLALALAGLAALMALESASPAAAVDPAGLARFQSCSPTTDAFVSLEAAPEVTGPIPLGAGLHRLWDLGVAWRDVNPAPGQFRWDTLDAEIAQVEASGSRPMLVLGLTPQWAAANPNAGDPRWGPGTASPPKNNADWQAYVQAVVDRYGKRIAAYEVWNEANLQTFWTGTPEQMAQLTAEAYAIIKASQPDAIVLTPSVTTRLRGPMRTFMRRFLPAAAGLNYPFDVFAIHTYPAGNQGTEGRVADITNWQGVVVDAVGATSPVLDRPIWDTEINYGLAGPGSVPGRAYSDAEGAALLVQTFLDSQRLGIDATFWYLYTAAPYSLLGVQLWEGTPITRSFWEASRRVFAAGTACPTAPDAKPFDVDAQLAVRAVNPVPAPGTAVVTTSADATPRAQKPSISASTVTVTAADWSITAATRSRSSRWPWSAYVGDTVTWRATGLAPASRVYLWEATTGAFLGAATTDAAGAASGSATVPPATGGRALQWNGFAPDGSVRQVTVGVQVLARATSPARTTVRFADGSGRIDAPARARLQDLAGSLPPGVTTSVRLGAAVAAGASAAERRLARDRMTAVQTALRKAGVTGAVTRTVTQATSAAAERAVTVAISFPAGTG